MNDDMKPVWPWIVALLIGLPVLYVLSSGPLRTVAFRDRPILLSEQRFTSSSTRVIDRGPWWPIVYAPLVWASNEPWGERLQFYWHCFPIREVTR